MLFEGEIVDGAVVMDEAVALPNGTRVRVEPVGTTPVRQPIASLQAIREKLKRDRENPPPPGPTLAEVMAPFVGCLDGLPADAALNHDHYIRNGLPASSKESGSTL